MLFIWITAVNYCDVWDSTDTYYKPRYTPEPVKYERKKRMNSLMKWQMYKSDRFVVTGNIGYRVVITDRHEDKAYEIAYSEMTKFRKHWEKVSLTNRDSFLVAFTTGKEGRNNQKAA